MLFLFLSNHDLPTSFATIICISSAEESRRVNNRLNVLMDLLGPHDVFWTDNSKASIIVKFQDRVEQIHNFFDACRRGLEMFPLNPQPKSLIAMMAKFKN